MLWVEKAPASPSDHFLLHINRRHFEAANPWRKMGTDVTEFKQPWDKTCFAPVYDVGSKEIGAWSTSLHPDMAQQHELLDRLLARKPEVLMFTKNWSE